MNRWDGFTLTELLVVLVILGILSALVIAAVAQGKAKARSIECVSNLRHHGVALSSFLADRSEYPLAINPESKKGIWSEHGSSVYAALKIHGLGPMPEHSGIKKSVYLCPAAVRQSIPSELQAAGRFPGMYGYNVYGLGGRKHGLLGLGASFDAPSGRFSPVRETQVLNPSGMIAMGDGVRGWGATYEDSVWVLSRTQETKELRGSTARVRQLHHGRANILRCDGHVDGMTLVFLFADTDDAALAGWNRDQQPHRERLD